MNILDVYLFLYRRAILRKWKELKGSNATYGNLLRICCKEHLASVAEVICDVLKSRITQNTGRYACGKGSRMWCSVWSMNCIHDTLVTIIILCRHYLFCVLFNKVRCVKLFLKKTLLIS